MRKNLRTSSAGSAVRAFGVRGALSMKMGAFISLAGVLALSLALPTSALATGGPASLNSTLTNTINAQTLFLTSSVTTEGTGFRWTFTLTNPANNTVHIRAFTVAPNCDLHGVSDVTIAGKTPGTWTFDVFAASPQVDPTLESNKINFFLPALNAQDALLLLPGQTIVFSFHLANGADQSFRGHAGALDTFGFSGGTLGCPPPPVSGGGGVPPPSVIEVRQHGPFYLAEAYPAGSGRVSARSVAVIITTRRRTMQPRYWRNSSPGFRAAIASASPVASSSRSSAARKRSDGGTARSVMLSARTSSSSRRR